MAYLRVHTWPEHDSGDWCRIALCGPMRGIARPGRVPHCHMVGVYVLAHAGLES